MTSADANTHLSRERTREAADRTLMAWIRTSLSLIGFGFGIGKVNDYIEVTGHQVDSIGSLKIFGIGFITLGVVALFAAVIQHVRLLRRLENSDFVYKGPWPIGLATAILLLVIGLFGLVMVL